jgi:hypothetical protein
METRRKRRQKEEESWPVAFRLRGKFQRTGSGQARLRRYASPPVQHSKFQSALPIVRSQIS